MFIAGCARWFHIPAYLSSGSLEVAQHGRDVGVAVSGIIPQTPLPLRARRRAHAPRLRNKNSIRRLPISSASRTPSRLRDARPSFPCSGDREASGACAPGPLLRVLKSLLNLQECAARSLVCRQPAPLGLMVGNAGSGALLSSRTSGVAPSLRIGQSTASALHCIENVYYVPS